MKAPRHAGELAIIEWLHDNLVEGIAALVVYEDRRVPRMVAQEPDLDRVAVLTTLSFLELAEERRIIPSAAAAWGKIVARVPAANPTATRTTKPSQ